MRGILLFCHIFTFCLRFLEKKENRQFATLRGFFISIIVHLFIIVSCNFIFLIEKGELFKTSDGKGKIFMG